MKGKKDKWKRYLARKKLRDYEECTKKIKMMKHIVKRNNEGEWINNQKRLKRAKNKILVKEGMNRKT